MRLQQFLALAGVASRRKCEELITEGRIRVNGAVVRVLGTKVAPDKDAVEIDGSRVRIEKKVYVLLNKPRGYLCTVTDQRNRPTVIDLVGNLPARVYPVGRLDKDTEGVLLMTNDGPLCHRLTHPRFGVEKTYRAVVRGKPSRNALDGLRRGVDIGGSESAPAKVSLVGSKKDQSTLEIVIHEGRKRQVKRMCKTIGHSVVELTRIEFAGLRAGNLKPGRYRFLSAAEVGRLRKQISLKSD